MKRFLYLPLMPESLIASHLPPCDFGSFLVSEPAKPSRGPALFMKLDDDYADARLRELHVPLDLGCSHGHPRQALCLAIYRVLEQVPVAAMESLHLATGDGRVLDLSASHFEGEESGEVHLYQEFCPVTPRVVSDLDPQDFGAFCTDPWGKGSVPTLVYADLKLDQLSNHPEVVELEDLPYVNFAHMRSCLGELRAHVGRHTRTVLTYLQQDVLLRTIDRGFYVATSGGGFKYFPMPARDELETVHSPWWRSALSGVGG